MKRKTGKRTERSGGIDVTGNVQAGGDIVGRDKITHESHDQVASGKFVWQTNVRIGTLVVPVRLVLAVVAVGLLLAAGAWFAFVPAQMPLNTFNIVVADFGQVEPSGRIVPSADGANLSRWLFGQLQTEALSLPTDRPIAIWHDSLNFTQKRAAIGLIPDERVAAALARSLNAHMVIYGNLALNQAPATFTPQFYVAELGGEADELLGSQQLGSAIPVQPPIDFNNQVIAEYFDLHLRPRAETLVWFTRGLVYDLSGQHDRALAVFQQAEAQLKDPEITPCVDGRAANSEGKEVLYYFIGREALFLARDENEAREAFASIDEALAAAEAAFNTALEVKCDYARAHFGLGNVYQQRAQRVLSARRFDAASLAPAGQAADMAIAEQSEAVRLAAQTPGSGVEVKARIALGAATFVKGQVLAVGGDHASAAPIFQTAIDTIQAALPSIDADEHRLLAQTYQTLAGAYYLQGHSHLALGDKDASRSSFGAAIDYYDRCIAQAEAQVYDNFLQVLKTNYCLPQKNEAGDALARLDAGS